MGGTSDKEGRASRARPNPQRVQESPSQRSRSSSGRIGQSNILRREGSLGKSNRLRGTESGSASDVRRRTIVKTIGSNRSAFEAVMQVTIWLLPRRSLPCSIPAGGIGCGGSTPLVVGEVFRVADNVGFGNSDKSECGKKSHGGTVGVRGRFTFFRRRAGGG
jgi:hypothetical protein